MIKFKSIFLITLICASSNIVAKTIYDNGTNIGINVRNPKAKLHTKAESHQWAARFDGASDNKSYGVLIKAGNSKLNQALNIQDQFNKHLFMVLGNGNVGVNITRPKAQLHTKAKSHRWAARFDGASDDKSYGVLIKAGNSKLNQALSIQDQFNKHLLMVYGNGNVTIGSIKAVDNYKLTVNGGIYALDLKIRPNLSNTADFVFEDDYELMPLDQVKASIQANKHLPGIPSAKTMVENGVSVAEMQAQLLQKIEELTLYVIALKEENKYQEQEIQTLKNQKLSQKFVSIH